MREGSYPDDPKGLIFEAYRIEGITAGECRSIFLDWALSIPGDAEQRVLIEGLLARYGSAAEHPMTAVLQSGLAEPRQKGRRGGRAARLGRQT
jgi:hypothetical protein